MIPASEDGETGLRVGCGVIKSTEMVAESVFEELSSVNPIQTPDA
jgi:hypothetical protein